MWLSLQQKTHRKECGWPTVSNCCTFQILHNVHAKATFSQTTCCPPPGWDFLRATLWDEVLLMQPFLPSVLSQVSDHFAQKPLLVYSCSFILYPSQFSLSKSPALLNPSWHLLPRGRDLADLQDEGELLRHRRGRGQRCPGGAESAASSRRREMQCVWGRGRRRA